MTSEEPGSTQENRVDKTKGNVNITGKGDVIQFYQYNLETAKVQELPSEPLTRALLNSEYEHLRQRWASVREEYLNVFPTENEFKKSAVPGLAGEILLVTQDIVLLRALIHKYSRENRVDLVKAKDYPMVFMSVSDAIEFLYEEDAKRKKREQEELARQQAANACCYVVTAVYGTGSSELRRVRARCRQAFHERILLKHALTEYKYWGPRLAARVHQSRVLRTLIAVFLARPILAASERRSFVGNAAVVYLLCASGVGRVLRSINRART